MIVKVKEMLREMSGIIPWANQMLLEVKMEICDMFSGAAAVMAQSCHVGDVMNGVGLLLLGTVGTPLIPISTAPNCSP